MDISFGGKGGGGTVQPTTVLNLPEVNCFRKECLWEIFYDSSLTRVKNTSRKWFGTRTISQ